MDIRSFISKFFPDFGMLFSFDYSSPSSQSNLLSSLILLVLLITFFGFLFYIHRRSKESEKTIHYYIDFATEIENTLKNGQISLEEKSRELKNKEKEKNTALWSAFDQSLIKTEERTYRTIDVAYFFNTHTLAQGLTESRFIAAVPGFLTAIGVLGTFAGLTFGLGGIDLNGTSDQMKDGIGIMISGASTAFITSLWGVFFSLIFNVIEKIFENTAKKKINQLQNKLNALFPQITAEQTLSDIRAINAGSKNHLAELDEKIGSRFQTIMEGSTNSISQSIIESLEKALNPAINKLVENANEGSSKVLETVIQEFLSKIGNAGEMQKSAMDSASQALSESSEKMMDRLSLFLGELDSKVTEVRDNNREMLEQMRSSFLSQLNSINKQQSDVIGGLTHSVNSVSANNAETLDKLTKVIEQFMEKLTALLGDFNQSSQSTIQTINHTVQEQQLAQQTQAAGFMEKLANVMEELNRSNVKMLSTLEAQIAESIEAQSNLDKQRADNVNKNIEAGRQAQATLTESVKAMLGTQHTQNQEMKMQMDTLLSTFQQIADANKISVQAMENSAIQMKDSGRELTQFSEHLKTTVIDFAQKLNSTVLMIEQLKNQNNLVATLFNKATEQLNLSSNAIGKTSENLHQTALSTQAIFEKTHQNFNQFAAHLRSHIGDLNNQVADLLNDYAKQVQEQTNFRLEEWNKQTIDFISNATRAIEALNSAVDEFDGKINK